MRRYVEECWYWEGVLALRKLAMVSVTMFASSLHQAMAAVLVLLMSLVSSTFTVSPRVAKEFVLFTAHVN